MNPVDTLKQSLLAMDRLGAEKIIRDSLDETEPLTVVETLIAPALEAIGDGWECGNIALSQIYMSSRIGEQLVESLLPQDNSLRPDQPSMAIVVLDDYHMLGKRIVRSVLQAAGYQIEDWGRMDLHEVTEKLTQQPTKILFVSTLMLRAALQVDLLTKSVKESGCDTRIVVGGAPFRFDPKLAEEVGATATASSAASLLRLVAKLTEE